MTESPNIQQPPSPLMSLTASAKRLTGSDLRKKSAGPRKNNDQQWQTDSWDMYDLVGEFRSVANTIAGRLGQAKLFVGRIDKLGDDPIPVDDPKLNSPLRLLGGTPAGRAQLMVRLAINMYVAGEGWMVGIPADLLDDDPLIELSDDELDGLEPRVWRMLSVSELKMKAGSDDTVELDLTGTDGTKIEAPADDLFLIRVWNPHPKKFDEADASSRASLPILRELVGLTMHISAQVDSRLAGAGLLIVPQSAQQALAQAAGVDDPEKAGDQFTEALIEAMMTPIQDRASASAVVPLVVTVPDDAHDKFHHMDFSIKLDGEARSMRDEAIRRLALSQDAPPEILLGTSNMNHWGAWLTREETVTGHIEPPLALICDALTTQYLWPTLIEEQGMDPAEAHKHVIWYDVAHLIVRPNHGADALTLHDRGVLSNDAVLRETGFDSTDMAETPEQDEALAMALQLVAKAPTLLSNVGLPHVVAQIRAVMDGTEPPAMPGQQALPAGDEDQSDPDNPEEPNPRTEDTTDKLPPSQDDAAPVDEGVEA